MKLPVFMKWPTCVGFLALSAGSVHAPAALAVEAANATAFCQGVLPAADSQIRKRPLALRNEGAATAFVSCSIPVNFAGANSSVTADVVNRTAAAVTVNCTLVDGLVAELGEDPDYYPLSLTLDPGPGTLQWTAQDFQLVTFSNVANLSCALPPGVKIALIGAGELL